MLSPRFLDYALRYQTAAVALGGALALFLWPAGAWGILGGGVLAALNFWFLRFALARLMQNNRPKAAYLFLLAIKFVGVLAAMALMVLVLRLDPIALALGLFTLFLGIGAAMAHVMLFGPPSPSPNQPPPSGESSHTQGAR